MGELGSSFNPESEAKTEPDSLESLVEKFDNERDKIPELLRQKSRDELDTLMRRAVDWQKELHSTDPSKIHDQSEIDTRRILLAKSSALFSLILSISMGQFNERTYGDDKMKKLYALEQDLIWKRGLAWVDYLTASSVGDDEKADESRENYYSFLSQSFETSRQIMDRSYEIAHPTQINLTDKNPN